MGSDRAQDGAAPDSCVPRLRDKPAPAFDGTALMAKWGSAALQNVHFRPHNAGDEAGISGLFQTCHGRERPIDVWMWRYREAPFGDAITDVAETRGEIIAHLASVPVRLHCGSESMPAGLWVDIMVHPDFRNLTLFLRLAEAHRERCAKAGLRILFAFPNDRSYGVLRRLLAWHAIEEIAAFESPLDALRPLGSADHGWKIDPIVNFGPEFSDLWERVRPKNAWTGSRQHEWLQWRYRLRPRSAYPAWSARDPEGRLVGWLAAKVFRGGQTPIGDILDFWFSHKDAAAPLFCAALDHFRAEGVRTVSAWALTGTVLYETCLGWGLSPTGPTTHFAGRWSEAREMLPFPSRGAQWHIQKGDSDVF